MRPARSHVGVSAGTKTAAWGGGVWRGVLPLGPWVGAQKTGRPPSRTPALPSLGVTCPLGLG